MKKILMLLAIAVCAASAQADAVPGMGFQARYDPVSALKGEQKELTGSQVQYFTLYSMSATTLKGLSGLSSLSVDNVTTWLNDSFADNSKAFKDAGYSWQGSTGVAGQLGVNGALGYDMAWDRTSDNAVWLLARKASSAGASRKNDEWQVLFYNDNDGNNLYRVIRINAQDTSKMARRSTAGQSAQDQGMILQSTTGNTKFVVNQESSDTTWGAWTAASVPEPTSGLLLLLGVAGLALKRKRA